MFPEMLNNPLFNTLAETKNWHILEYGWKLPKNLLNFSSIIK